MSPEQLAREVAMMKKELSEMKKELSDLKKQKPAPRAKRAPTEYNIFMKEFARKHKGQIASDEMWKRGAEEWKKLQALSS